MNLRTAIATRTRLERGLPARCGRVVSSACELSAGSSAGSSAVGRAAARRAALRAFTLIELIRTRLERGLLARSGRVVSSACELSAGSSAVGRAAARRAALRAFTLIELILVMVLITIVMSVALPSLKGFFKGRDLDSEARRFLSLTRYAASRAVAEGVPMELYVDTQQKRYGLRAQAGFLETDGKAVEYQLPEDLSFEVTAPPSQTATGEDNFGEVNTDPATISTTNPIKIARFYPDGFIGDKSPAAIVLHQRAANDSVAGEAVAIAQSATRLNYEIRTVQPQR